MSHFTLGLITKSKPQKSNIEELLEPFSAHKEVKTITPREDVIKNAREWLKQYQKSDLYQEYLEDPEKYKEDVKCIYDTSNGLKCGSKSKHQQEIIIPFIEWLILFHG